MALALEEKYDQVRQLINMGKERGYLLYDEVNDILPAEVHSSEEIDDLLSTFERYGIDIYEDIAAAKAARAALEAAEPADGEAKEEAAGSEEDELDLTPGRWRRPTTPCACICARWAPSPADARRRSGHRQAHRARPASWCCKRSRARRSLSRK